MPRAVVQRGRTRADNGRNFIFFWVPIFGTTLFCFALIKWRTGLVQKLLRLAWDGDVEGQLRLRKQQLVESVRGRVDAVENDLKVLEESARARGLLLDPGSAVTQQSSDGKEADSSGTPTATLIKSLDRIGIEIDEYYETLDEIEASDDDALRQARRKQYERLQSLSDRVDQLRVQLRRSTIDEEDFAVSRN